ncbi:MAG: sulfatase-like hydrolase/transferase [Deltaproteobacteria bacterium]|nr:sulfatase-like hydrolase/transferase [Deltaproteobacteria bacterium]
MLEAAFWLGAFSFAALRPAWVRRHALRIGAVVLAAQLASAYVAIRDYAEFAKLEEPAVRATEGTGELAQRALIDDVSSFSSELNVILIVLDSFQSDFFAEVILDPELESALPPGFTFYRNAVSLYPRTEYSVQSMLTGEAIPDNVHLRGWVRGQVSRSLPTRLAESGFDAVLATFSRAQYRDFSVWDYRSVINADIANPDSSSGSWSTDVYKLLGLAQFRLTLHFFKRWVYDDGRWGTVLFYPDLEYGWGGSKIQHETRTDLATLEALTASASAEDEIPRFRFYHFYGTHQPYSVDETCSYQDSSETSRPNVVSMSHCILTRLFEFFHQLDEIGVYDRSLIFVLGDHGQKYVPLDRSVASPPLQTQPQRKAQLRRGRRIRAHWLGVPLFLAKPIGKRGSLRISDAPVSLCDVPRSVFSALSMPGDYACESIFDEQIDRRPARRHFRYPNIVERRQRGIEIDAGTVFEKYEVVDHSWLRDSWIPAQ